MKSFTDEELKRVKESLTRYGVSPGIDVCNYFDDPAQIAALLIRLNAAERVCKFVDGIMVLSGDVEKKRQVLGVWRKAKGEI